MPGHSALCHTAAYAEGFRSGGVKNLCALRIIMEGPDDAEESGKTSDLGKNLEQAVPADEV